jgi:RNA polymerase sigma factor (sigma-70 family)
VKRHAPAGLDESAVKDLAQDIVLGVLVKMRDGSWRDPRSLRGWVRRVVKCRLLDAKREERRRQARHDAHARTLDDVMPIWMSADLNVEHRELGAAIRAAIQSLPDQCGRVWMMVRLDNLSYVETAAILGITRSAVCANVVRAQRRIRLELIERGFELPRFASVLRSESRGDGGRHPVSDARFE